MDSITKFSGERGGLPERFYNQLDDERTIQEKYISEKQRVYDEIIGNTESEETNVSINTTYKEI